MGSYVPSTPAQRAEMLAAVGVSTLDDLYRDVPRDMLLTGENAAPGVSELEAAGELRAMAAKNHVFGAVSGAPGPMTTISPPSLSG